MSFRYPKSLRDILTLIAFVAVGSGAAFADEVASELMDVSDNSTFTLEQAKEAGARHSAYRNQAAVSLATDTLEPDLAGFHAEIQPILAETCFNCHGEKKQKGELRLDARAFAFKGGHDGAAIVADREAFVTGPTRPAANVKLFCKLDAAGAVSDLQSADPGFTAWTPAGTGPYTGTVTFPATLPTGKAPDADLPAGTTITVEVEASNTAGTDSAKSNTVTPA